MLSFTRKNGQLSFYLAHKLYKNGLKKGTVPEKINSHLLDMVERTAPEDAETEGN